MNSLCVFFKEPRAGEVKTRLGKDMGMEEAAQWYRENLSRLFNECLAWEKLSEHHTLRFCPAAACSTSFIEQFPFLQGKLYPQSSGDLGVRMSQSLKAALDAGASKSIIIGSDIPDLGRSQFLDAFLALNEKKCVIGPGFDGGYYLLGLNSWENSILKNVRWSSEHTLNDTIHGIQALGWSYKLLEPLRDVDTLTDLQKYHNSGKRP